MKYVESDYSIRVNWTIQRGASGVKEDFRRASLSVFLLGPDNAYPVNYTLEDNAIKAVIEPGLPEGVYGLKAVWYKDSLSPVERAYLHKGKCPFGCGRWSQSQVDHVFGVTELPSESESAPENTLHIDLTTAVATYGYDGLSAYEIAVMSGLTTLPREAWVANLSEINSRMREVEDSETARKSAEKQRVAAEASREQNETERAEAENKRASEQKSFAQNEFVRAAQESTRVSAEKKRVSAEAERAEAERLRQEAEASRSSITYYTEQKGKAILSAPEVSVASTGSGKTLHLEGYRVEVASGLDDITLTPGGGYKVRVNGKEVATVDMLEDIKARLAALEGK